MTSSSRCCGAAIRSNDSVWRDGQNIVDVLPATPDVIAAGHVVLADGYRMNTLGFDLALARAERASLPGTSETVEVASLASIVVLKIAAWLDRPHQRRKDLEDLGRIFEAALDEWDDRRWGPPLADVPHEQQAAFFIGLRSRPRRGPVIEQPSSSSSTRSSFEGGKACSGRVG